MKRLFYSFIYNITKKHHNLQTQKKSNLTQHENSNKHLSEQLKIYVIIEK